jgi:MFS family permease
VVGVLRYREFRLLFTGQLVSLFGDGLFAVALSFAVLEQTGSKSGLGIVLAAGTLPLVAFLLVGGVWADRLSRRRVMLAADGARMAIQGILAALVLSGNASVGRFILLYGLYGVAMAFFSPASTGLIPQTLPADELQSANGLLGMTRSVTAVAGGAAGGLLVDAVGPGSAIALDAGTFAVSALALALMRVGAVSAITRERFVHELAVGWREVKSRRWVWMEILVVALYLMLYVAPFEVVGPIVSRESLGGPIAWGLISASFAAGMAAGGLGMMLIRLRRPMVVAPAILLFTCASPLLLAHAAPIPLICGAYFVEGVAVGIWTTTWETTLQREIPAQVLSRVSAWDWMGSLAGMPLGFALTGPLLAIAGERPVLYAMAAVALVLTVWMLAFADLRDIGITHGAEFITSEA